MRGIPAGLPRATAIFVEEVETPCFMRDALLAAAFALAYVRNAGRLPGGVSVSDLMGGTDATR